MSDIQGALFRNQRIYTDYDHIMCNSSLRVYHPFPAPKKNLGGQKFKDDHELGNSCDRMSDSTGQGVL
jgi:hypothetical protein